MQNGWGGAVRSAGEIRPGAGAGQMGQGEGNQLLKIGQPVLDQFMENKNNILKYESE